MDNRIRNTSYEASLPQISWSFDSGLANKLVFPRRVQATVRKDQEEPPILQSYVNALVRRASRLLCSTTEFESGVRQSAARAASLTATVSKAFSMSYQFEHARFVPWLNEKIGRAHV